MDMTPPQSPPALAQGINQQAVGAFQSLVKTQQWLLDEHSGMPAPADAIDGTDRQAFLHALEAFWSGVGHGMSLPRKAAWADAIARTMRDMATLREADGTLGTEAARLALRVVASRGQQVPGGLEISELAIGSQSYAGTLVARAPSESPAVVVFTPDHGWETFDDLDSARASMEQRIRRAHAAGLDPAGITRAALLDVLDTSFINLHPVHGDVFDMLVAHAVEHQRRRIAEAFVAHAAPIQANRDLALADAIDAALQPHAVLDIESMLAARETLLIESIQDARLGKVPANVRAAWESAWEDHRALLRGIAEGQDDAELVPPGEFAAMRLREALQQAGVTASPDGIVVTLERSLDPAARMESLQAFFEGPAPVKIALTDLAWQNMAAFDLLGLRASDANGNDLPTLNGAALRGILRNLDLYPAYTQYLTGLLRDGAASQQRRERTMAMQRSWMRIQANEARLSYYLPGDPRSLRPDHSERGYRWIEAVLDAPERAQRRKVEGHEVVVREVTYQGVPLTDVFEIGVASTASLPTVILYTPEAPDGITWREFDDRNEAGRQFFYHPRFREYLLDRLPARFAKVAPNGQVRTFNIDGRSWIFGGAGGAAFTQTGEPFVPSDVNRDFLGARYDAAVNLAFLNMASYGRSAADAQWEALFRYAALQQTVVSNAVLAAVTAPFRAPGAAWRFYDSVKAGDGSQAFVDFVELYNYSLSVVPAFSLSRLPGAVVRPSLPAGAAVQRATFRSGPSGVTVSSRAVPRASFDTRYLARNVRKEGQPNGRGLYTVKGEHYIEHDGALYAARWDTSFDTVRLRRPGAGPTGYGPAIRRAADGQWAPHGVGLGGGGGDRILRSMLGHEAARAETGAGLNAWEHASFQRNLDFELFTRVPNAASRFDLLRQVEEGALMGRAPALSAEQSLTWQEASRAAHQTVTASRRTAAPPQVRPIDMSPRVPPVAQAPATHVPPGYRVVAPSEVPSTLYLVDQTPFKSSSFQRKLQYTSREGHPYSNDYASLLPQVQAPGISGVPVTTRLPSSATKRTFAVPLSTVRVADRMNAFKHDFQILERKDSGGTQFLLRSLDGRPLTLFAGDFQAPILLRTP
jgi:hypothetical protein